MDRQIKFRGKGRKTGKWFYGNLYDKDSHGRTHICTTECGCLDIDPDTVGQFTGLTDCNGKEIYEGDILQLKDWAMPCEVVYVSESASFQIRYFIKVGYCIPKDALGYWVEDYKNSVCIIGNIYDTPELLKKVRERW